MKQILIYILFCMVGLTSTALHADTKNVYVTTIHILNVTGKQLEATWIGHNVNLTSDAKTCTNGVHAGGFNIPAGLSTLELPVCFLRGGTDSLGITVQGENFHGEMAVDIMSNVVNIFSSAQVRTPLHSFPTTDLKTQDSGRNEISFQVG